MENFNENGQQQFQQQPQYQYQYPQGYPVQKPNIPNAVAAMVLGILSIVTSCWFVGLILGIIGLVLANKGKQIYETAPNNYGGYGMLNAGRITSIIGICIGGLYVLISIIYVAIVGSALGIMGMADMFQ